jgi:DNA-binding NtrC family response regulator
MPEGPVEDTLNEQDERDPSHGADETAPYLFLVTECARVLDGPARHCLANVDEVVFGRGLDRRCHRVVESGRRRLLLRSPDGWMSSTHAYLRRRGDGWAFEDAHSTNGSSIDGRSVSSTVLSGDALIELGRTFFFLRTCLPAPPGTPDDLVAQDLLGAPAALATTLPVYGGALKKLQRIATSRVPVLLLGETGTGKELVARAIHDRSGRTGAFVAVNCGALTDTLLESQLFGHVKGAFSGAVRDELGYLRTADAGTLFLDEIGDLPVSSQTALLRVLQENEVVPVGTTRPIAVDLRVVAATHAPIDELVRRGAFRSDLLGRLAGYRFALPPLRERREDLGLLMANLLRQTSSPGALFSPAVVRALLAYSWPRNARELAQALASAVVLAGDATIEIGHLPAELSPASTASPSDGMHPSRAPSAWLLPQGVREPEDESLRQELLAQFARHRGNVSGVARALGKARTQIQRWMKRFEIDPAKFR